MLFLYLQNYVLIYTNFGIEGYGGLHLRINVGLQESSTDSYLLICQSGGTNSTYNVIKIACDLQVPITAVCVIQDFDSSVKEFILTTADWLLLNSILKLFTIFVRPCKKLQGEGDTYPTMNYALPTISSINKQA